VEKRIVRPGQVPNINNNSYHVCATPWTEDADYSRDLLFHLREPVMLPKEKFEVGDYVGTVYTIRSRNTRGPEILFIYFISFNVRQP
jgi:hypothetical protein